MDGRKIPHAKKLSSGVPNGLKLVPNLTSHLCTQVGCILRNVAHDSVARKGMGLKTFRGASLDSCSLGAAECLCTTLVLDMCLTLLLCWHSGKLFTEAEQHLPRWRFWCECTIFWAHFFPMSWGLLRGSRDALYRLLWLVGNFVHWGKRNMKVCPSFQLEVSYV